MKLICKETYQISNISFFIKNKVYDIEYITNDIEYHNNETYKIYSVKDETLDTFWLTDNINVNSFKYIWNYFYNQNEIRQIKINSL